MVCKTTTSMLKVKGNNSKSQDQVRSSHDLAIIKVSLMITSHEKETESWKAVV